MIAKVLSGIEGIEAYAIAALLIFVPFFLAVTARVFLMKRSDVDAIARIPLEDEAR